MSGNLRVKACHLRSLGWSLDHISHKLNKPRSTVYYWITKVPLTQIQIKSLEKRRQMARLLGGKARKNRRLKAIESYIASGLTDVKRITPRELFLIGIALYWAEGSKQHEKCISQGVGFCNQDPKMLLLFCKWLDLIKIPEKDRKYTIYIHEQYRHLETKIKTAWCKKIDVKIRNWEQTIFKHGPTNRKVTGDYLGLIRIAVVRSTDLNRRISGWTSALASLA